jgi:hypothetical protein
VGDRAGRRAQPRPTRLGRTEKASSGSRVISCPVWARDWARLLATRARLYPPRRFDWSVSRSVAAGGASIYSHRTALGWWGRVHSVWGADGWDRTWRGGGICVAPSLGSPGAVHTSAVLCSSTSTPLCSFCGCSVRGGDQLIFKCCAVRDWFDWYKSALCSFCG